MVGFGHRIGRTLRVPGRGLRRTMMLLVVLVTADATALGKPADAVPGTFTGLVLDPASNKVLWQRTPGTPLMPGSTAKLITTSAALLTLNPTSSLVTRVVAGGEPGAVVLVGGGDPTLNALTPGK